MQAQEMKYRNVLSGYATAADDEAHVPGVAALPAANVLAKHRAAVSAEQLSSLSRLESMLCPHPASAQSSLLSEHATRRRHHTEARAATARQGQDYQRDVASYETQSANPYTPNTPHHVVPQQLVMVPQGGGVVSMPPASAAREGCYVQYLEDEVDILTRQQSDACRLVVRVTAEKDRAGLVSAEVTARYALVEDEHDSFLNLLWLCQSLTPRSTAVAARMTRATDEGRAGPQVPNAARVAQREVGVGTSASCVQQSGTQTEAHDAKSAATQTAQPDTYADHNADAAAEATRQTEWQCETTRLVAAAVQDALHAAARLQEESTRRWQLFCDAVASKNSAAMEQLALLREVQRVGAEHRQAATLHALQDELTQLREVARSLRVKLRESERSVAQLGTSEMNASMSASHVNSSGTSASAAKYAGVSGLYIPSKLQASLAPARRSLQELREEAATLGVRPVVVPPAEEKGKDKGPQRVARLTTAAVANVPGTAEDTRAAVDEGKAHELAAVARGGDGGAQDKPALPAVQSLPCVRRITLDTTSSSSASSSSRATEAETGAAKSAAATAVAEAGLVGGKPSAGTSLPDAAQKMAKAHVRTFSESGSVTSGHEVAAQHHANDSLSDLSLATTTTTTSDASSSAAAAPHRGSRIATKRHEGPTSSQPTTNTTATVKRRSSFDEDDGAATAEAVSSAVTPHLTSPHTATLPHIDARVLPQRAKTVVVGGADKASAPKHRLQLPSW